MPTSTPTTSPVAASATYGTRVVNADRVNVRSQPSLSGTLVSSVTKGSQVTLLSDTHITADGYNWRKVRLSDGQEGYIAFRFLEGSASVAAPTYKQVNAAHVNVRTSPTTAAEVVTRVSSPEKVELLSESVQRGNYNWIKIKTSGGKTGWIVDRYLGESAVVVRYINGDFVNIRSSASTTAKIVKVAKKGTRLVLLTTDAVSANGHSWYKVQLPGGAVGWVATEYLVK